MNSRSIRQALRGLASFGAALAALLLFAGGVQAATFSVNPVRVTLSAKQPVAAITVRNPTAQPAIVQLETTAWSQDQGQDVLNPSADLLATPPIFTVPPGGTQIVRVGLRGARDAKSEQTYRLILREVPPAKIDPGLHVMLRISMPVFVVPPVTVAPAIKWRAARTADGKMRVYATNNGNAHVQVAKVDVSAANGPLVASRSVAEYVLPGNTRAWTIDAQSLPEVGAKLHIASSTDAGAFESDVALEVDMAASTGEPSAPLAAR